MMVRWEKSAMIALGILVAATLAGLGYFIASMSLAKTSKPPQAVATPTGGAGFNSQMDLIFDLNAIKPTDAKRELISVSASAPAAGVFGQPDCSNMEDLKELSNPTVCISQNPKGLMVAGFRPFEEVRILKYRRWFLGLEGPYVFWGGGRLKLDENGMGVLRDYDSGDFLIIIGESFDLAMSTTKEGHPDCPPLDYEKVVELYPTAANAYYYRGRCGDYSLDKSLADYSKAIELKPDFVGAYNERASLREQQGDYNQAIADYSKVIELTPNDIDAYYARGRLVDRTGNYAQALADFTRAITLETETAPLGTMADYTRVIELDPGYAVAYYRRATLYIRQNDNEKAVADLDKAIELAPSYASAYNERASLYETQGKYDQAITDYGKAIELDPGNRTAYNERARLCEQQGNFSQAIADYSKVIELTPNDMWARYARGRLLDRTGNYDQALADFTQAIILESGTDPIGTIADYTRVIELNPGCTLAYYRRATLYAGQGDNEKAVADLDKAIELAPNYASAYYARSLAHYELRRFDRAVDDSTEAIELHFESLNEAYYLRGNAYHQLGDNDHAIADYANAIRLALFKKH